MKNGNAYEWGGSTQPHLTVDNPDDVAYLVGTGDWRVIEDEFKLVRKEKPSIRDEYLDELGLDDDAKSLAKDMLKASEQPSPLESIDSYTKAQLIGIARAHEVDITTTDKKQVIYDAIEAYLNG